jgi:hypothetical protein
MDNFEVHMVSPEDEEKARVEQKQQRRKAGRPRKEEKAAEYQQESDSEKQDKEDKIENPESHQAEADSEKHEEASKPVIAAPVHADCPC